MAGARGICCWSTFPAMGCWMLVGGCTSPPPTPARTAWARPESRRPGCWTSWSTAGARRQVLILDSCFSGAFAHGAKGEADLGLQDRFLGQGRGRVVLTASAATEYSFEGDPTDTAIPAGSVFTAALVQGLRTGAADTDHDGHVSVDDAYAYVFDQVQAVGAAQTPQRWLSAAEGQILLARNPAGPTIIEPPRLLC